MGMSKSSNAVDSLRLLNDGFDIHDFTLQLVQFSVEPGFAVIPAAIGVSGGKKNSLRLRSDIHGRALSASCCEAFATYIFTTEHAP